MPFRPTPARAGLLLASVLMAAATYGLTTLCGRLRMDIIRTGTCTTAPVTGASKEHLTVRLDDGTRIGLYGYGLDLTPGTRLRICVSPSGTWADARGDASNWLLTPEPAVFPAAAAGMLAILALYAGDGDRIRRPNRRTRSLIAHGQRPSPEDHRARSAADVRITAEAVMDRPGYMVNAWMSSYSGTFGMHRSSMGGQPGIGTRAAI